MQNRRRELRIAVTKPAELLAEDGTVLGDCHLLNLSSRGARLAVTNASDLPERLVLRVAEEGVAWPCRIVRRDDDNVGVLFV